ncbi:MAG TPA: hypothetical protein VLA82_09725 [Actinomycetota bacterium]|nr:hypothetical protein [Actinomycetota bacterium]
MDRPRGSFLLYAVAFGALVVAGVLIGVAAITFLDNLALLWASVALSALATVSALASVLVPRR